MIVVSTKKELKQAIKKHEPEIVVIGDLACKIKKAKGSTVNTATTGIAATITITVVELALLLGFTLSVIALTKGYDVTFNGGDGSCTLNRKKENNGI